MGRYAYFSTGFEYKFSFGVQSSEDILLFEGRAFLNEAEPGFKRHMWEKEEISRIQKKLDESLKWLGEEPVNFQSYEGSALGTYQLMNDLLPLYKEHNEELTARYILGSIIYHQLLYNEILVAEYEG